MLIASSIYCAELACGAKHNSSPRVISTALRRELFSADDVKSPLGESGRIPTGLYFVALFFFSSAGAFAEAERESAVNS